MAYRLGETHFRRELVEAGLMSVPTGTAECVVTENAGIEISLIQGKTELASGG